LGAGAVQQQTAGPFAIGMDTRQSTGYQLGPSELKQLQEICSGGSERAAFAVDTAPGQSLDREHRPGCDFFFGSIACSCWREP
jgi:hypothetical protein